MAKVIYGLVHNVKTTSSWFLFLRLNSRARSFHTLKNSHFVSFTIEGKLKYSFSSTPSFCQLCLKLRSFCTFSTPPNNLKQPYLINVTNFTSRFKIRKKRMQENVSKLPSNAQKLHFQVQFHMTDQACLQLIFVCEISSPSLV